jgi:RNA polymerase sigma-70 factor (ECF subfamily)
VTVVVAIHGAPGARTKGISIDRGSGDPERERLLDPESRAWIAALSGEAASREEALARLHALLVGAARFQLSRRASKLQLRGERIGDLATEAADDALVGVLAHVHQFRGESRFVTWACKFAILQVSTTLRRRMWKERERPIGGDDRFESLAPAVGDSDLERLELSELLRHALTEVLSERQRTVFLAVAVNGVPIDVVADRFATTRGAIYKTLHDARRKLRVALELADARAAVMSADR